MALQLAQKVLTGVLTMCVPSGLRLGLAVKNGFFSKVKIIYIYIYIYRHFLHFVQWQKCKMPADTGISIKLLKMKLIIVYQHPPYVHLATFWL